VRFDPDRFAPSDKPKKDRPYFPFSLGPRRCLGEYFSFLEMKVHLGLLLPRFRMQPVDDAEPELELAINLFHRRRTRRDRSHFFRSLGRSARITGFVATARYEAG
jgi:cytochrome P450